MPASPAAKGVTRIQATCSRFHQSCQAKGLLLHQRGFKISYETTIPRQLGLSGSSALICATFNCLLNFFDLAGDWPVPQRPQFILDVEASELGITGGLMDRVAQVCSSPLPPWPHGNSNPGPHGPSYHNIRSHLTACRVCE